MYKKGDIPAWSFGSDTGYAFSRLPWTPRLSWRESARDGIYDDAGNLVRSDGSSSARYIGTQAELVVNYHPARNWDFECAFSRLVPGRFIEETGRSKDAYFASAEIRFNF